MTVIAVDAIMIEIAGALPENVMTDNDMTDRMSVADRGSCDTTRQFVINNRTEYVEKFSAQMVEIECVVGR